MKQTQILDLWFWLINLGSTTSGDAAWANEVLKFNMHGPKMVVGGWKEECARGARWGVTLLMIMSDAYIYIAWLDKNFRVEICIQQGTRRLQFLAGTT